MSKVDMKQWILYITLLITIPSSTIICQNDNDTPTYTKCKTVIQAASLYALSALLIGLGYKLISLGGGYVVFAIPVGGLVIVSCCGGTRSIQKQFTCPTQGIV